MEATTPASLIIKPGKGASMADNANHTPDTPSTSPADTAALDASLLALVERRRSVVAQIHATDDDDVDTVYDELDGVDEQIAAPPANSLGGIRLQAAVTNSHAVTRIWLR
jgi:hypothetical protein